MEERPDQFSRNGFSAMWLVALGVGGVAAVLMFVYGLLAGV
ncbi:hypothetical protein [Variovorax paradoxus]|nr:hypothetical protein [Variovorax paradoxus]WGT64804.1 hypothetical protein QHG62_05535 [Variovorax paradoxus]